MAKVNTSQVAFALTPLPPSLRDAELQVYRHCQSRNFKCCMTHLLLYVDFSVCLAATFTMLQVIRVGQPCHRRMCTASPVACMAWFAEQLVLHTYSRSILTL